MTALLEKKYVVLWEAESIIQTKLVEDDLVIEQQVQKYMQEEPFYGEPDYSYY